MAGLSFGERRQRRQFSLLRGGFLALALPGADAGQAASRADGLAQPFPAHAAASKPMARALHRSGAHRAKSIFFAIDRLASGPLAPPFDSYVFPDLKARRALRLFRWLIS
jgi:hypothetical protein